MKGLRERLPETFDAGAMAAAFPELVEQLSAVGAAVAPSVGSIRRGRDVERKAAEYVWMPYVPKGDLTLIAGEGEAGKTWFASEVVGQVQRGGKLPTDPRRIEKAKRDGKKTVRTHFAVPRGEALILQRENDEGMTLLPRLDAVGADAESVVLPNEHFAWRATDEDGVLVDYLKLAWYVIAADVTVVFIDPITGFIDCDMSKASPVRKVLERLQAVARFTGCSILFVSHLNKNYDAPVKHRIQESVEFYNVPRSVLLVTPDPETKADPDVHDALLYQEKNNRGQKGGPLAFKLDGNLELDGTLNFSWGDAPQGMTASDVSKLLNDVQSNESRDLPGRIRDVLLKVLVAADRPLLIESVKVSIAEELGSDRIDRNAWKRATRDFPVTKVEVAKGEDGRYVESPGSGVWAYRPLTEIGDDGQPVDELRGVEF